MYKSSVLLAGLAALTAFQALPSYADSGKHGRIPALVSVPAKTPPLPAPAPTIDNPNCNGPLGCLGGPGIGGSTPPIYTPPIGDSKNYGPSVHNILATQLIYINDFSYGISGNPQGAYGNATISWKEGADSNFVDAIAQAGANSYEFRLVVTSYATPGEILGLWDVYKDNVLACNKCVGRAYGLDRGSDYFKIYVGSPTGYAENWHLSGYISNRTDF